jgi:hypothetical protein
MTKTNGQLLVQIREDIKQLMKENREDHHTLFDKISILTVEVTKNTEFRKTEIRNKSRFYVAVGLIISIVSVITSTFISIINPH